MKIKNSGIRRWLVFWVSVSFVIFVIGLIPAISADTIKGWTLTTSLKQRGNLTNKIYKKIYTKKFSGKTCTLFIGSEYGYRDIEDFNKWKPLYFQNFVGFLDKEKSYKGLTGDQSKANLLNENIILYTETNNSNNTMTEEWEFVRDGGTKDEDGSTHNIVNVADYRLTCPKTVFSQAKQDVLGALKANQGFPSPDKLAATATWNPGIGYPANRSRSSGSLGGSGVSRAGVSSFDSTYTGPGLVAYITDLYDWAIGICASLAVLMIMYGGYRYMASQSEPSAITEAKEIVVSALSGLILLGLVWLIKDAIGV